MMSTAKTGKEGENLAATYLIDRGYTIIEQNFRFKRGEIDLIAQKDGFLIFIEVKTRSSSGYGFPENAVDSKKEELIIKTAESYIMENDWQGPIRFDIVSVSVAGKSKPLITHFEDAFH